MQFHVDPRGTSVPGGVADAFRRDEEEGLRQFPIADAPPASRTAADLVITLGRLGQLLEGGRQAICADVQRHQFIERRPYTPQRLADAGGQFRRPRRLLRPPCPQALGHRLGGKRQAGEFLAHGVVQGASHPRPLGADGVDCRGLRKSPGVIPLRHRFVQHSCILSD